MKKSDHWVWLRNTFAVTALVVLIGFAAAPAAACTGDCGNIGTVTVTNIVTLVDIALQTAPLSACPAGDTDNDKVITVDEILQAVNNALNGCHVTKGCGNGVVEADLGEECDDGGTCLGGTNAGTPCTAESDCQGNGVCIGGANAEVACADASGCPGGTCKHCVPQGGDGCAANCTTETTVKMDLKDGVLQGSTVEPGTSGSTLWPGNPALGPLALPFIGATQTLAVGKQVNSLIPVVILTDSVSFPPIDVGGLACACVRGVSAKTCGGTLFEADGTGAPDCTPGYIPGTCSGTTQKSCTTVSDCTGTATRGCVGGICGDCNVDGECPQGQTCVMHACDGKNPCAFVHGSGGTCSETTTKTCRPGSDNPANKCPGSETCVPGGNGSSGAILCAAGLPGTNMLMTEDSKRADGQEDPPPCDPFSQTYVVGSTFPQCGQPPVITLSDQTPPIPAGSSVVLNSTAIGQFSGGCGAGNPNQPKDFCTNQEAFATRGVASTLPALTGTASAQMNNIFLGTTTTESVCNCSDGTNVCEPADCIGPLSVDGSPLPTGAGTNNVCSSVPAPNVSGLGLAGAFTSLANPQTGDIVVTDLLQGK